MKEYTIIVNNELIKIKTNDIEKLSEIVELPIVNGFVDIYNNKNNNKNISTKKVFIQNKDGYSYYSVFNKNISDWGCCKLCCFEGNRCDSKSKYIDSNLNCIDYFKEKYGDTTGYFIKEKINE